MKKMKLALLCVPTILALSACEGYELVRTDAFPYGGQRTAGSGVAYVLAKMAPEKELKLDKQCGEKKPSCCKEKCKKPEHAETKVEEVAEKIEQVFNKAQSK